MSEPVHIRSLESNDLVTNAGHDLSLRSDCIHSTDLAVILREARDDREST